MSSKKTVFWGYGIWGRSYEFSEFKILTMRAGLWEGVQGCERDRNEPRCFQEMTGSGDVRRMEEAPSNRGRPSLPHDWFYILQRYCSRQCGWMERQIVLGGDNNGLNGGCSRGNGKEGLGLRHCGGGINKTERPVELGRGWNTRLSSEFSFSLTFLSPMTLFTTPSFLKLSSVLFNEGALPCFFFWSWAKT